MFFEGTKFVGSGRENEIGVLYARYDPWFLLILFLRTSCAGYHLATQLVVLLYVLLPFLAGICCTLDMGIWGGSGGTLVSALNRNRAGIC